MSNEGAAKLFSKETKRLMKACIIDKLLEAFMR
jgi:hypothetical protein